MDRPNLTLGLLARTLGAALAGLVGTALLAMGLLLAGEPLQPAIYDAYYLAVGPWTAEETAVVVVFVLASLVAAGVMTLAVGYLRYGASPIRPLAALLGALVALVTIALLVTPFLGVVSFLAALLGVAAFAVAVPIGARLVDAWPAGMAAFAGALPALAVFLLLLGFGLGWGGGYDLVARELPDGAANESVTASFDEVPAIRDDLFTPESDDVFAYCESDGDGLRECHLTLRGYDREAAAARFLARHGVRCPYRGSTPDPDRRQSFRATHDGDVYRVSCVAYGD